MERFHGHIERYGVVKIVRCVQKLCFPSHTKPLELKRDVPRASGIGIAFKIGLERHDLLEIPVSRRKVHTFIVLKVEKMVI